jgi:hypothetical protein
LLAGVDVRITRVLEDHEGIAEVKVDRAGAKVRLQVHRRIDPYAAGQYRVANISVRENHRPTFAFECGCG